VYVTRRATRDEVRILRSIAEYQFGVGIGREVVPEAVYLRISKSTGRVRAVLDDTGRVLYTVRAYTHTLIPTIYGALLLHRAAKYPRLRCVVVSDVVKDLVERGSSVFSRHIMYLDEELRAGDEVLVVDESDKLLCTGTLKLSPLEVLEFIRGSAVRIRACILDEIS